ncbi:hypothetical protein I316_00297 [Kwoniella heveanensis BCC8398]|uniref:Uncharacterized protein n=1 Tax=Kwoniella heveanensis BCC8398 TaxID=1296120 RepID=A0A1B9H477_9TREE|nr:hypothetical protein I316_00297 [Kwoniella heveanensis BCC8398]
MSDQVPLPPPRLIITPSTPLLADTFDHVNHPSSLPSPSGSRHMYNTISLPNVSEKRSSRSRSGSRSSSSASASASRASSVSSSYDVKTHRSSSASPMYLSPPPSLASPMSGKRPLRSPLISILFIGFTLLLLLSTAFCTSDTSVRFLEMQQEKFRTLRQKSGKAFSLGLGGGREGKEARMDFVAGAMEASTAPRHDGDTGATVSATIGSDPAVVEEVAGVKGKVGEDGLIMSSEEWKHYTSTIGGPAVSMTGQVWDIEW